MKKERAHAIIRECNKDLIERFEKLGDCPKVALMAGFTEITEPGKAEKRVEMILIADKSLPKYLLIKLCSELSQCVDEM